MQKYIWKYINIIYAISFIKRIYDKLYASVMCISLFDEIILIIFRRHCDVVSINRRIDDLPKKKSLEDISPSIPTLKLLILATAYPS